MAVQSRYDLPVQPLDDESPPPREPRSTAFWVAFAGAYSVGILLLNGLDDVIHRRATGHPNDGGVMILSVLAVPVFAGMARFLGIVWKRYKSLGFAVGFAIFGPLLVYLIWIAFSI
jgi:hypothetical protein